LLGGLKVVRRHACLTGLLLALGMVFPVAAADTFGSAYISEFMADNQHGVQDDDGDRSGWIELQNGTLASINLAGWFLTDSPTNLAKWRFPAVALLPNKYMVVFASAKNRTNDLARLHTSFRLNKQGGYLALVGPATNVVSELTFGAQTADVSYGRVRGEPAIHGAMPQPTPGGPNPSSGPGFAPLVIFSRPGGSFSESFTLQLSSASTGAVIRYTLDGKLPTRSSPVYDAPLLITNTTYVRARSYQAGVFPGAPQSEAYLKLSTNVLGFASSLPVLVMDTFGKHVQTSTRESFVYLSLFEPAGQSNRASSAVVERAKNGSPSMARMNASKVALTNRPTLTSRGGFRIRGSTSSGFPQSPFAVTFLDEFNEERHLSPLGLPAESDWVLYAPNAYDLAMIHNPLIYQLSRDMGRYSPRTRFIEVFVVRSSGAVSEFHYNGLYVLTEKIKIGPDRVNIDHLHADDLKPPNVTGGYMMKFDRVGPEESGFYATGDRGLVYVEPKEQAILAPQRTAQRQYLKTFFAEFERALNGSNWKDPARGYRAYLDVDAAIDFHVLEVLSGNVDAMVLSTYFHKPRQGKITFGPHWDFDRALGSTDGRDDNPRQWNTGPFFGGEWWPRLFGDPDFWQQWVDRWQELRRTHFSLLNLNNVIDQLCDEVREAQPREYAKWGLQPRGGSYQSEIELMKDWLSNRIDFIDGQLVPPPRLSVAGGKVASEFLLTVAAAKANATVYYTLDGSDPRLAQGAISSNAVVYTGPIQLKADVRVVARARDTNRRQTGGPESSTPWSGPVMSAAFTPLQRQK
jgi:hypothetical protein